VAYNFQTGSNNMKPITKYENVAQNVLLSLESTLHNAIQLQYDRLYFVYSGLKIIGHGNSNNNLESVCILYIHIPHTYVPA
jgi:hypothetical protein